MRKVWSERRYERTATEVCFEENLKQHGFGIVGVKEFHTKTDYLIEKGGISCTYTIHHCDSDPGRGRLCYDVFLKYYTLKVAILKQ